MFINPTNRWGFFWCMVYAVITFANIADVYSSCVAPVWINPDLHVSIKPKKKLYTDKDGVKN